MSINPVMMLGPVVSAYGSSNSIMEMKLALEGNEFKTLSNKVLPCANSSSLPIFTRELSGLPASTKAGGAATTMQLLCGHICGCSSSQADSTERLSPYGPVA